MPRRPKRCCSKGNQMIIDELSNTYLLALISAIVGFGAFAFSVFQHFSEASLAKARAQYDAKQLLRAAQLSVALEIMDLVGRFVNPETKEQFDRDWHDFATIYSGRASLIDDADFQKLITKFGQHFWRDTDLGYEHFGFFEGKAQQEFEKDGLLLNARLNKVILKQFHMNPRYDVDVKSFGNKDG